MPDTTLTKPSHEVGPKMERTGELAEDFVDSVEAAITSAVPRTLRDRINPRQNTIVNVIWRALVLVAGLGLILLGLALLVLPGPGWGCILLGLIVLASEYTWANRLVGPVRRRVGREAQRVRSMSPQRQAVIYAGLVICSTAFIVGGVWYFSHSGMTWPPW